MMLSEKAEHLLARLRVLDRSRLCVSCIRRSDNLEHHEVLKAIRDLVLSGDAGCRQDVCSGCDQVELVVYIRAD
jgi:hypothetical protein